jgi:hypothetical protein
MRDVRISMTAQQAEEFVVLHQKLREVLRDALVRWPDDCAEVTCIFRGPSEDKKLGGSGVHATPPPYRAIDLRVRDWGPGFQQRAEQLAAELNSLWVYDPSRPHLNVAVGKPHGTGPHLHLQVHPATRRRAA